MRTFLLSCVLLTVIPAIVSAQTGYPMVMSFKPAAVQAGSSGEVEFQTRYSMLGAYQILVSGTGVSGEIQHPEVKAGEKPNLTKMKVKFTVNADAMPGVRDVKMATPTGVSTVGQLVVVSDPVIYESGDNNTREKADALTLPATVCGLFDQNEDVDFFRFSVEAGAELNFHVRCGRLQDRIHDLQRHADALLTIRNANGGTVVSSDNHFYGDPFIAHRFERGGDYFVEIRDVRYHGNVYWEYSIEITDRPFISNVYPLGVAIGQETPVELIGSQLPEQRTVTLAPDAELAIGPNLVRVPVESGLSNAVPVYATDLPVTMETSEENNTTQTGQLVTIPAGINGRISRDSDVDCFQFEAKKGDRLTFEVRARRYQSSLDPYIRILKADGSQLTENDDLKNFKRGFADSRIENWAAPEDGTYILEIRDMHLRGGDSFVYFIEATTAEPHFRLYVDTDKTLLAPGKNGVFYVQVERKNGFTGDVQIHVEGLPEGVEAICGRILPDTGRDGCVILKASPDAKLSVANLTVRGTSTWQPGEDAEPVELAAVASVYQEMYQPGGGRGHWPVESHTLSITRPTDVLAVKLSTYDVVLKPGESKKIEVTIERAEGFDKNVSLDMRFFHLSEFCNTFPPGVKFDEGNSSRLITGKKLTGHVVVTAAADAAEVDRQLIPVTANVSLNFVMKTSFCADPLWVSVKK